MTSSYLNPSRDIPPDIAPPETWPEFGAIAAPAGICTRELVGMRPQGIRWSFWPFTFEEYVGDEEPNIEDSRRGKLARSRQICWKRVHRSDTPPGWRESKENSWRVDGYHRLVKNEDYTRAWSHGAEHDLRVWQGSYLSQYEIVEISFEAFAESYRKSTVAHQFGLSLLHILERKYLFPLTRQHLVLWGVRNVKTGEIVAGTAAHYPSSVAASVRECPFVLSEGREARAQTALMEHWFKESGQREVETLYFTYFWQPGEPKAWKGFSDFKSHFGFQYVAYPRALSRWVPGKLF